MIVAAHGRDELNALRRGLESELPYVGLVASAKRGAGVLDELRVGGVADGLLARIDVPAGIQIGSQTAGEIAVSILAKVVEVRRTEADVDGPAASEPAGSEAAAPGLPPASAKLAVDPVCGMTVAAVAGTPSLERDGETI